MTGPGPIGDLRLTWLIIVCLALWAYHLHRRLGGLTQRLDRLETSQAKRSQSKSEAAEDGPPSLLSAPAETTAPPAIPMPWEAAEAAEDIDRGLAGLAKPVFERPARSSEASWSALSTWLAENGLAWLGGVGLALGGLFLVVYAAQQGVFTPSLRIVAAAALGLGMVAASEWIRRQRRTQGRHALASAVAAGAGAVTLYGAVWAALVLYGLISLPFAGALTVAISLGLLGLSMLHGEPLAMLALFGALLAPAVTGGGWSLASLQAYLALLVATGAAVGGLRRWFRAGLLVLAGLLIWAYTSVSRHHDGQAALLLALVVAGPLISVLWNRRAANAAPAPNDPFSHLPLIALVAASLGALLVWWSVSQAADHRSVFLLSILLIAVAATMATMRLAPAMAYGAPVAVGVIGLLVALLAGRSAGTAASAVHAFEVIGLVLVIVGGGLAAALRGPLQTRTQVLAVTSVAVAVLATLAWPLLEGPGQHLGGWTAALAVMIMSAGAVLLSARVEDRRRDPGLGVWVAATAELVFLTAHVLTALEIEPAVQAVVALALAALATKLPWRGLAATAMAGSLASIAVMLRPSFVERALSGALGIPLLALVAAVAAGALLVGARVLQRGQDSKRHEAEALSTAALVVLLFGLFLLVAAGLRRYGHPSLGDGGLLEASLRTLFMLCAGLLLVLRARPDDGPVARWRAIIVTSVGAAYGVLGAGLVLNPWWGEGRLIDDPPVFNTLLLALLAPALILAAIAKRRPDSSDPWTRAWTAASAALGLCWVIVTLRHLFHGAAMFTAVIGYAEACAYAVVGLLTAKGLLAVDLEDARAAWLRRFAPMAGWLALAFALLVFGWLGSPWWGPSGAPMRSSWHAVLVLILYGAGAGAAIILRRGQGALSRAALCAAVAILFAFVTLLLRWSFHGPEMRQGLDPGGLETWMFSAVWAIFGLIVLIRATLRKDLTLRWLGLVVLLGTAGKVLLFDMTALGGVVRAASFLAVGALLIIGALMARRLNANGGEDTERANAH